MDTSPGHPSRIHSVAPDHTVTLAHGTGCTVEVGGRHSPSIPDSSCSPGARKLGRNGGQQDWLSVLREQGLVPFLSIRHASFHGRV